MFCPHCFGEVSGIGAGDESRDFCVDCSVVVEGESKLWSEVKDILEDEQDAAIEDWLHLLSHPRPSLKHKRSLHLAELSVRMAYETKVAWTDTYDWRDEL
jgi:hypothetical protein